jgi:hypothetical protein
MGSDSRLTRCYQAPLTTDAQGNGDSTPASPTVS